jgi:hypothetical protein
VAITGAVKTDLQGHDSDARDGADPAFPGIFKALPGRPAGRQIDFAIIP